MPQATAFRERSLAIRYPFCSLVCRSLVVVLALAGANSNAGDRCTADIAHAVSIQGVLDVRLAGETGWQAASRGQRFCPGDAVRTGANSRAAIQLYPETVIRLDQSSSIVFTPADTAADSSWLELLKGAAHLISRDPRSLKIITPFANAAIEGTEFLIEVDANRTGVTVYEGRVRVETPAGEAAITSGEKAIAQAGLPPVRQVVVHPRDAVQWTLYYPPVLQGGDTMLQQAADALAVGRIDAARGLLDMLLQQDPGNSDALALQSIIALTQNDKDSALALASRAVAAAPESATAGIALSYAQQAHFDLSAALASLQDATRNEPDNALAWARLAELWMSVGDLDQGVAAAERAVALDPNLAHSHTVLGFARLTEIEPAKAMQSFEKAIELDQAAPLPRLGLGLARIRRGDLEHGRKDIETAVALDPGNSLIRSYMGKAYFEEKRGKLAATQYEMARELDPNDPTPWFYDAIRKQMDNRPVEALHDLQTSIKLNDNRAVYRSRLELDDDLATRSASIARIYRDLGFEQRALVEGWQSVNSDPTNYSAHRLLADSYSSQPRHEIARVSELLQSQLLQPINLTPVQPQLAETDLLILEGAGPSDAAFQEYNPLFTRNRLALQADGLAGGNDTLGDDLTHNGVHDNWSWSVGQFHYESDGYRPNNDQKEDIYNLFVQTALSHKTSIQAELRHRENETGDLRQRFDPNDFVPNERNTSDTDTARLGLHHTFSPRSEVIASLIWQDKDAKQKSDTPFEIPLLGPFVTSASLGGPNEGHTLEMQHLYRAEYFRLVSGAGYYRANDKYDIDATTTPSPPPFIFETLQLHNDEDARHGNAYLYGYLPFKDDLTLTLGASYDNLDIDTDSSSVENGIPQPASTTALEIHKFNPKLGISWSVTPETTLRAAGFRSVKRSLISSQTIEPTQVAGFNQFYDDSNGAVAKRYGIGLDHSFTADLSAGLEYSRRDLDTPYLDQGTYKHVDWEEQLGRAYLFWTPHERLAINGEYQYERFDRDQEFTGEIQATRIRTYKIPISVRYFHPQGYSAGLKATFIDQEGDFTGGPGISPGAATEPADDQFWIVDATLGYRLPKRRGMVSAGVSNLFDESFNFVDTDAFNPRIYPERILFGRLTLAF